MKRKEQSKIRPTSLRKIYEINSHLVNQLVITYKHISPRKCLITVWVDKDNVSSMEFQPKFTNKIWYLCCTRNLKYYWGNKTFKTHKDTPRNPSLLHDRDHKSKKRSLSLNFKWEIFPGACYVTIWEHNQWKGLRLPEKLLWSQKHELHF